MKPSEYFADVMQKNHVIAADEYELYQYSLNEMLLGNNSYDINQILNESKHRLKDAMDNLDNIMKGEKHERQLWI